MTAKDDQSAKTDDPSYAEVLKTLEMLFEEMADLHALCGRMQEQASKTLVETHSLIARAKRAQQ